MIRDGFLFRHRYFSPEPGRGNLDQILCAPDAAYPGREIRVDVAILGGGVGGCAAALAATRMGKRVLLTEETDWIGGQFTQQAVPPDEHPWIEQFGCTRSYRRFRNEVRDYYRHFYPLTEAARRDPRLNPGGGLVSYLCHEPRVGLAVLSSMLAPALTSGRLVLLLNHCVVAAETDNDRVRAVLLRNILHGTELTATAPYFIDATELGDLLPLTKTEYVTGFESQKDTGEPNAPEGAQPSNMQGITWCFAVDHVAGEDHTIDKPQQYAFWRDYIPKLTPPWTGPLLSWTMPHPITMEKRTFTFDPEGPGEEGKFNLWLYRRIADRAQQSGPLAPGDISLVNWPQNDYWIGPILDVDDAERDRHLEAARQLSLSLLYWMQTEAPRPDGGTGWKGLRLRGDVCGTNHGLAKYPYIREARRIRAEFTVCEQHISARARAEAMGKPETDVLAELFSDTVGVGFYRIDLHPTTGGDNYLDISSLPYQIPLGDLIPQRVENLLAGCKNLGVTHITNGCYRVHPTEWNVGEAAGALAAFCLEKSASPRQVRTRQALLEEFQNTLVRDGVEIDWPCVGAR